MKKIFLMLTLAVSVITASCTKDIDWDDKDCDRKPTKTCESLIDGEGASENVTSSAGSNVMKAWIEGDNLKLEVGYSGCDKHTFDLHLTDDVVENPKERSAIVLQLVDNNGEHMCQAYFQETLCFDISKLKVGSHGEVGLKLQNHDVSLVYKY